MSDPTYTLPKVWTWDSENGGAFASTNRPIAGATHDKELPRGEHKFQLHSMGTPNGVKVTILFEELLEAGHDAEYDAWYISIGDGDQFGSGFTEINPNSKIPAMLDLTGDQQLRVFESGAILVHLAEKFGAFLPSSGPGRTEVMNWLMWQMGSAPFLGGGFGHFYVYAPEKYEYPINRYAMETKRQMDVLDRELANRPYIAGDEYSIADMAIWPWYGNVALGNAYGDAATFLSTHEYKNLMAWAEKIAERPAVKRGRLVNRKSTETETFLLERHSPADFDGLV
jgi:GST-like protein